jgi:hypothetical protein
MSNYVTEDIIGPDDDWRELSEYESAILTRLLEIEFQGRNEIQSQLAGCVVRQICGLGTIRFKVKSGSLAKVNWFIPVEATACDSDGYLIHYLLHVENGRIAELEIYTDTTFDIKRIPKPDELFVFEPQPPM